MVSLSAAILIQYPPARGNPGLYLGLGSGLVLLAGVLLVTKGVFKTRISKDTCFFVLFVIAISLSTHILANLVLDLEVPFQTVTAISVVVSTPLSCVAAGYSRRTLKNRLKKLGLNKGITLVAILVLSLIPIIEYPRWIFSHLHTVYVLPSLKFRSTENTPSVNGQINSSGFYAEVPIYENRTFEANRIVELAITDWDNECMHT